MYLEKALPVRMAGMLKVLPVLVLPYVPFVSTTFLCRAEKPCISYIFVRGVQENSFSVEAGEFLGIMGAAVFGKILPICFCLNFRNNY